jgi:pSer/pThr/pTyr-binding forkhead associated (FHA) protein
LKAQFKVLSGKKAGNLFELSRFPCTVGRSIHAEVCLEEPGVWDRHFELSLRGAEGFFLRVLGEGTASVNGKAFEQVPLRNGDLIEIGSQKLQFYLSPPAQYDLRTREMSVWILIALWTAAEVYCLYWLAA